MSGIAAIIRFDGGEVGPGQIEEMTAAMAYRRVDGIAHWRRGPVALGHGMLHTTQESLEEVQPLANEDESAVLVMDGWLSNWLELRAELLARGAKLRNRSDAELVLRSYEVWGDDCPRHIDGEFAFVVWDARRREAFCARDHAGLRPLHYHWDGKRLIVASDIAGVLAGPGVEARRNRGMIAEYMANEFVTRDETIWKDVKRVLPAHWLRFDREGSRSGEYWLPPLETSIFYDRDEDYFAHYREVLADCVRRTARSHLPVAFDVSGGLDSSANFCVAHELLKAGRLQAPAIDGYCFQFEFDERANEIEYSRAIGAHTGAAIVEVPPFLPDMTWFEARGREYRDMAGYPNGAMMIGTGLALTGKGSRVSLNGEGGDEYLTGKPFYYQEQLAAREWRVLARTFREDARDIGLRRSAWNLYRFGLGYLLPRPILDLRHRIMSLRRPRGKKSLYWLSPEMKALMQQRRPSVAGVRFLRFSNLGNRSMYMALTYPWIEIVRDHLSRQSATVGYEIRSPMLARNFIEFAFATPERMKLRGSTRKFIHANALNGLLPDVVAKRTTKADFLIAFTRHLDYSGAVLVDRISAASAGYLDPHGVAQLYEHYRLGSHQQRPIWELWNILAIGGLLAEAADGVDL